MEWKQPLSGYLLINSAQWLQWAKCINLLFWPPGGTAKILKLNFEVFLWSCQNLFDLANINICLKWCICLPDKLIICFTLSPLKTPPSPNKCICTCNLVPTALNCSLRSVNQQQIIYLDSLFWITCLKTRRIILLFNVHDVSSRCSDVLEASDK